LAQALREAADALDQRQHALRALMIELQFWTEQRQLSDARF
jgi:hypothetical protein